jgi:xanthine dehydrogenase YagR molybdenum-binding subunit
MAGLIGQPLNRADALLKVTGRARYAGEERIPHLAHAVLVQSTIANGRVVAMDTQAAEQAPGTLLVMTPFNAPRTASTKGSANQPGEGYPLLQDDEVHYNGQHIGLVVAESFEQATHAAALVKVKYEKGPTRALLEQAAGDAQVPKNFRSGTRPPDSQRGSPDEALAGAPVALDVTYTTPVEHHNPMEPHAVIAAWQPDGTLVLYHSTQAIANSRERVATLLGLPKEKVRTISPFVGGGFGTKGSTWPHVTLAAMAARVVRRPVKLVLTRRQMFTSNGYRSKTIQHFRIGAERSGSLVALRHDSVVQTATFGEFVEPCGLPTEMMYACPNLAVTHRVAAINAGTPTFMRAPGEASGMAALESAMDELAYALDTDPLALRIRNHADRDEHEGKPWSSKSLLQCYQRGADAFGWSHRPRAPRAMQQEGQLIGWGMASATYPMNRSAAGATVRLLADGSAVVRSGTQDIGTGTYTIMRQVAADALGLPVDRVRAELGDSLMPPAPVSGGSQSAASVMPAIAAVASALRKQLADLALGIGNGPFAGLAADDLAWDGAMLHAQADPARRLSASDVLRQAGRNAVESTEHVQPGDEKKHYSMHSFGAHFVEVRVDPALGEVRVTRYVAAFAAGRILNAKTARSQMIGGIVYGLGMALTEETAVDAGTGRIVNANLAEYLVPVHADVPKIEIILVDEQDPHVNPLGIKGIGELPMVGAAAAVANAVYHATGVRVRDFPIRPEKLIRSA